MLTLLWFCPGRATPPDTIKITPWQYKVSPDLWFKWKHKTASFFYSHETDTRYDYKKTIFDTFIFIEFVQIDSYFFHKIKDGIATESEVQYIYDYYKSDALSNPDSNGGRMYKITNNLDILIRMTDYRKWPDQYMFNQYYVASDVNYIIGRLMNKDTVMPAEYVFVPGISDSIPSHSLSEWKEDTAISGLPTDISTYDSSLGYAYPIEKLPAISAGKQIRWLESDSHRMDLLPVNIEPSHFIQCQAIFISSVQSGSETNALNRYNRIKKEIQQDSKLFDIYLDSSDFWFSDNNRDIYRSFTNELIPEFAEVAIGLSKGEMGFTTLTQFGYFIIRAAAEPEKRDYRVWCKPRFYRLKN
ncbi:MAG: hypothetical protein JNL57_00060 [Bacteroidetes bacterium]|nr:hypothetical protein [Bacteroidota bacterium]